MKVQRAKNSSNKKNIDLVSTCVVEDPKMTNSRHQQQGGSSETRKWHI